jgi:hypothetical protein
MKNMVRQTRTERYRAELYLRSDTFGTYEPQRRVLDRMRGLEADGKFDRATLAATWQGVSTYERDCRDEALRTYEEFADWASANDFSLAPAFDRRARFVPGEDDLQESVVFPVVSLAVYEGDRLRAVLPATDDADHYTVGEALDGFDRGDVESYLSRFTGVTVDRTEPHIQTPVEA